MSKRPPSGPSSKAPVKRPAEPSSELLWSVPVAAAHIPETGQRRELVADEPVREAIAKAAGIVALPRLEASFDLMRVGSEGLRVTGRVSATIVQSCVVTLEPIESEVDEAIDLVFTPDASDAAAAEAEGLQAIEAGDPPEPLRDGAADLGAVATEFLLLGMDPYPRKPGAAFDAPAADDPSHRPFAALAALKKGWNQNDA